MSSPSRPVVAGVGDGPESGLAIGWAADAAERRETPLILVRAVDLPPAETAPGRPESEPWRHTELHTTHAIGWPVEAYRDAGHAVARRTWAERVRAAHETILGRARDEALSRAADLQVSTRLETGPPADVLTGAAADASLLVLGSRRLSALTEMLAASGIAEPVIARARCPVAVRAPAPAGIKAPVVAGLDGSSGAEAALAWAFEEAALWGAPLLAVAVVPERFMPFGGRTTAHAVDQARSALAEPLARWALRYPQVVVEPRAVPGHPVKKLSDVAQQAQARALAVGTRGYGGFRGMLLGSAAHGLIHRAACPLVVVPAAAHPDSGPGTGTGRP